MQVFWIYIIIEQNLIVFVVRRWNNTYRTTQSISLNISSVRVQIKMN